MEPSSLARMYTRFRDAEFSWIQQYDQQQQQRKQQKQQQQISAEQLENCSLHSGEFAFVLAGLKPAMLVQMPSQSLTLDFKRKVLDKEEIFRPLSRKDEAIHNNSSTDLHLQCRLITEEIASPEMPLQGCVLIWSPETVQKHPQASLLQHTIDRMCPPTVATTTTSTQPPAATSSLQSEGKSKLISESDLAILLDYPGRLPTTLAEMQQMIEVSYWNQPTSVPSSIASTFTSRQGQDGNEPPQLLTAFAAQPDQRPKIEEHFRIYRDSVRNLFGLNLKLHIQSLAE